MHPQAYTAVLQMQARLPRPSHVLEIGSRDINVSIRLLFTGAAVLGIDIVDGPGVDVVVDGATYVPPLAPDCVVCCEVFEHTPAGPAIVAHSGRILAPGGSLIVTCAGPGRVPHSAVDGNQLRPGEYYANVEPAALREAFDAAGFCDIEITHAPEVGDVYGCGRLP